MSPPRERRISKESGVHAVLALLFRKHFRCKVTVADNGKNVTKIKRVKVHAGEMVMIDYDDMEAR